MFWYRASLLAARKGRQRKPKSGLREKQGVEAGDKTGRATSKKVNRIVGTSIRCWKHPVRARRGGKGKKGDVYQSRKRITDAKFGGRRKREG